MGSRRIIRFLTVVGFLAALAIHAQVAIEIRPKRAAVLPAGRPPTLRVDTDLVLVPLTVCDPLNHPITGLDKEHFRLFDDRVEQTITHFAMDDEPLAVGLVLDISGSMGPKLRLSRLAASAFFKTANPEDEFLLVEFNDKPKLAMPLTRSIEEIQNKLAIAHSNGRTALLDAVFLSIEAIKKSKKHRKALLIISDGADNSSRYSATEVKSLVSESDVLIYAIGLFERSSRGRSGEELAGPELLNDITGQTGGRQFRVNELNELPDIAASIGTALRNRYVLGFSPTDRRHDGRYHRVQIQISSPAALPALRGYWRPGYYAPAD